MKLHPTFLSGARLSPTTLDLVFHISAVHQPFHISICISAMQHTAFIKESILLQDLFYNKTVL